MRNRKTGKGGVPSPKRHDLGFLLEAAVDRAAFESALRSVEPLADIEDMSRDLGMNNTANACRQAINNVEAAISTEPNPIMRALGLSDAQKELVEAVTAAEVLKFSILNSMDALRMLFINEFKTNIKFYDEEAIVYNVVPLGVGSFARLSTPQRTPFSNVKAVTPYEIHFRSRNFMIIGPETTGAGSRVMIPVPGYSRGIPLRDVPAGKIYIVGRNSDGDPMPVQPGLKNLFLRIAAPGRGVLDKTVSDMAAQKRFDLDQVVTRNFRIPQPAEGTVVSIYRAIRRSPAIRPAMMDASDFASEIGDIKLDDFRKYFTMMVEKTSNATGDLATYDLADSLFFAGLASVTAMLGLSPPPGPRDSAAAPSTDDDGAAGGGGAGGGGRGRGGGGSGRGGGRVVPQHSLRNILSDPRIATGTTPAERSANMAALNNSLDQDALRRALNTLTAGSVVFTESTVDRWCELAGIRENVR